MRLLVTAFLAMLLVACSSAPPIPDVPAFKTKQGKACAKQCEADHSICENNCKLIKGPTGGPARQRSNCKGACIRAIQACYSSCEAKIPVAPKKQ